MRFEPWRDLGHDAADLACEAQRDWQCSRRARRVPVHLGQTEEILGYGLDLMFLGTYELDRYRNVWAGVGEMLRLVADSEEIGGRADAAEGAAVWRVGTA